MEKKDFSRFYTDKDVCLIGSGSSVEKFYIDYERYDTVVGFNRIYQTPLLDKINILYYNMSGYDMRNWHNMLHVVNCSNNFNLLCFCPWIEKQTESKMIGIKKIAEQIKFDSYEYLPLLPKNCKEMLKMRSRPLTGLIALFHVMTFKPKSINLYGYDFYSNGYMYKMKEYRHTEQHSMEENRLCFEKILDNNSNYKWNK